MVKTITVTITRTFTEADDPFGLFSLADVVAADSFAHLAEVDMRYDVMQRDDDDDGGLARLRFVDALLEDAEWRIK